MTGESKDLLMLNNTERECRKMIVLDLDMDYFMEKIAHTSINSLDRLNEDYSESVWTEIRVREFLENNLGLSKDKRIKGRIITNHNEALFFWEELLSKGMLTEPFEVVHVDSHADLGLGCKSDGFLQNKILELSVEKRRKIRKYEFNGDLEEINMGDYLLWGIAYRMISKLTYCANPNGDKNDYPWDIMKDFKEEMIFNSSVTNYIQLKYNRTMEMPYYNSEDTYKRRYLNGATKDSVVEFKIIPTIEGVQYQGEFDYIVMAQSPNYTPANADFIIDVVKEYIDEI